jgi:hypothetical protein
MLSGNSGTGLPCTAPETSKRRKSRSQKVVSSIVWADLIPAGAGTLDPNRPTPRVSNIAQAILSELDRARGTTMTLALDIDAESTDGFPEDVENIVRDNAASLRITDFGFEGD